MSFELRSPSPNTSISSVKTADQIKGLMKSEPSITISQMAIALGLTQRGVEKAIKKLKENGEVEREDGKKGGHWKVIK